jgi:predicted neuraminidase
MKWNHNILRDRLWAIIAFFGVSVAMVRAATPVEAQPGWVKAESLFDQPPVPMNHAATICEVDGSLLAAWCGGARERALDVSIWFSRNDGKGWTVPLELVHGRDDKRRIQHPCWNPVLYKLKNGPLMLFYKVGPNPASWWGMLTTSRDGGTTWLAEKKLPKDIVGPVRNKPLELNDGTLLCGGSTENAGWRVHVERTRDQGRTWWRTPALHQSMDYGAIQPALLLHENGHLQMLCRTKQGVVVDSWSRDQGVTWSRLFSVGLPNPNSAVDAVMLRDGRALLVYNHASEDRGLLNVAVSKDGRKWEAAIVLEQEPGAEHSYPSVIQARDGYVHIVYSAKRERIRHVVLDPNRFETKPIIDGRWP